MTRTDVVPIVAEVEAAGLAASGTWTPYPPLHPGTSYPRIVVAVVVVLVSAVALQVLVDLTCTDCGKHYWQPATLPVPVPCTPGAEQDVDCMTLRLGTPWCLWAVKAQDRHKVASGQPENRTKTLFEGYVHLASYQRGVR